MMNRKRICALLLAAGLVLFLSVSAFFLAHEAGHDCHGEEDCPICRMMAMHIQLLRAFGLLALVLLSCSATLRGRPVRFRLNTAALFTTRTPVNLKIRLNN